MLCLDVNDGVNANTNVAGERPVPCLLTLNLCMHILWSIICLHNHSVYQKLESMRYFF